MPCLHRYGGFRSTRPRHCRSMISGSALSGTSRHCALSSASKRQVSPLSDISMIWPRSSRHCFGAKAATAGSHFGFSPTASAYQHQPLPRAAASDRGRGGCRQAQPRPRMRRAPRRCRPSFCRKSPRTPAADDSSSAPARARWLRRSQVRPAARRPCRPPPRG